MFHDARGDHPPPSPPPADSSPVLLVSPLCVACSATSTLLALRSTCSPIFTPLPYAAHRVLVHRTATRSTTAHGSQTPPRPSQPREPRHMTLPMVCCLEPLPTSWPPSSTCSLNPLPAILALRSPQSPRIRSTNERLTPAQNAQNAARNGRNGVSSGEYAGLRRRAEGGARGWLNRVGETVGGSRR
jgi:hypothetical protein